MGSYGGHVLPGSFFIFFGVWYVIKYSWSFLRVRTNRNEPSRCFGKIPCHGIVVEGVVKIFFISVGMLVELFYPGAPGGRLHNDAGNFTHPMNWQHATMYFFFGISGLADIVSHTARHVIPAGIDRLFGGLALFVEGYLFFFHLHGRSNIDTRIHILLVLTVWPSALFAFIECLVMSKRENPPHLRDAPYNSAYRTRNMVLAGLSCLLISVIYCYSILCCNLLSIVSTLSTEFPLTQSHESAI
uniref:Transmembrane protein 45B n=1 Tax=Ciona savignyi TaxID=51511 RepID=H2ZJW5_CIOSA